MKTRFLVILVLLFFPLVLWAGDARKSSSSGDYLGAPLLPPGFTDLDWHCTEFNWNFVSEGQPGDQVETVLVESGTNTFDCPPNGAGGNCFDGSFVGSLTAGELVYVTGSGTASNNGLKRIVSATADIITVSESLTDDLGGGAGVAITFEQDYLPSRTNQGGGWTLTGSPSFVVAAGVEFPLIGFSNPSTADNSAIAAQWVGATSTQDSRGGSGNWVNPRHNSAYYFSTRTLIAEDITGSANTLENTDFFFGFGQLDSTPFSSADFIGFFHADEDDDATNKLYVIANDATANLSAAAFKQDTGLTISDAASPGTPGDNIIGPFEWNKYDLLVLPTAAGGATATVTAWVNNQKVLDNVATTDGPDATRMGFHFDMRNGNTATPKASGMEIGRTIFCQKFFRPDGTPISF